MLNLTLLIASKTTALVIRGWSKCTPATSKHWLIKEPHTWEMIKGSDVVWVAILCVPVSHPLLFVIQVSRLQVPPLPLAPLARTHPLVTWATLSGIGESHDLPS